MIKAVFFDFYSTLTSFDPPREELQASACREFGISVDPLALPRGYWIADDFMSRENARFPIQKRPKKDEQEFWADYEAVLLKEAGVEISRELALRIFTRVRQLDRSLVLFDDVLPTLEMVKARGIVLGLVSNLSRRLDSYCDELGLTLYIDFTLTSSEVDAEKPHTPIFLTALERAGVSATEAIHVGDQYYADVIGARAAGIKPLLLDRDGFWEGVNDCPRIRSLREIMNHL
ncbi:MAG TPA: HAD-IA family hydrolase [Dehalococcoidia bacterium]|nr:HAD-IA family hydrolase [Dehalococcoidia bacterium]